MIAVYIYLYVHVCVVMTTVGLVHILLLVHRSVVVVGLYARLVQLLSVVVVTERLVSE